MKDRVNVFLPVELYDAMKAMSVAPPHMHIRRAVQAYIEGSKYVVDGGKLTQARIEAQMSMDDLAAKVGCNKASLSRWERGLTEAEDRFFIPLMRALNRADFVKEK